MHQYDLSRGLYHCIRSACSPSLLSGCSLPHSIFEAAHCSETMLKCILCCAVITSSHCAYAMSTDIAAIKHASVLLGLLKQIHASDRVNIYD